MISTKRTREYGGRAKKLETVECPACGVDMLPHQVHCNGSSVAYGCQLNGGHHGSQLWRDCWKCGKAMGCTECVPGGRKLHFQGEWVNPDLICKRCRVKVTLESLLNGGPISRFSLSIAQDGRQSGYHEADGVPGIDAYPSPWIAAYGQQCAIRGRSIHDDEEPDFRLVLNLMARIKKTKPMKLASNNQLRVERNRQHAELAEAAGAAGVSQ